MRTIHRYICTCQPEEVIRSCYSVFRLHRGGQELNGFESPETKPQVRKQRSYGWDLLDNSSAARWLLCSSPVHGLRESATWAWSSTGLLPWAHPWTSWWASVSSTSDSYEGCADHWTSMLLMPSFAPLSIVAWTTATVRWMNCQHTCSSDSSLSWMRQLGSFFSYLTVRVCQFRWQRSCTGSGFHIESCTSCGSWSSKVCMDWHPNTCPDDVFEFVTFLAVHISGRLQLVSSWRQIRIKRRLKTKGSHTVAPWHGTISPCNCGVTTAFNHLTVSKNTWKRPGSNWPSIINTSIQ